MGRVSRAKALGQPRSPLQLEASPQNQMLQSRRQDLEAQIRGLREEVEQGQGRLRATHEELMLLRRQRREHSLEVTMAEGASCPETSAGSLRG